MELEIFGFNFVFFIVELFCFGRFGFVEEGFVRDGVLRIMEVFGYYRRVFRFGFKFWLCYL